VTGGKPIYKAIPASDVVNTPAGSIEATTVQAALNELDTDKLANNVSATDKLLGRSSAGAGAVEEVTCTAFARTLLDDATAAAAATTLGLGTMATEAAADYVAKSLFDAYSILYADTDNTPAALTVGASTIVGRGAAGGIAALSASGARTVLGLATTDSPIFATVKLSGLTDGYIPYHVADATGLANSVIYTDGKSIGIGGSPSQQLDITGNFEIQDCTDNTAGVIYVGASSFIHTFHHPTGNTAVPVGQNLFAGINAGNFTMGSTATETRHGSYNVGIGYECLYSTTTGYRNTAIGRQSLYAVTTGSRNSAHGNESLSKLVDGHYNIAQGYNSGTFIADGITSNTTSVYSVYLGASTKASTDGAQNEIVIGYNAIGAGSNTIQLGNTSVTGVFTSGAVHIGTTTATTGISLKVYGGGIATDQGICAGSATTVTAAGVVEATSKFRAASTDGLASQTVALAKLTSGGADGSITIVGGIVTAYTAPT
jgi:hypothetical protein